VETIKTERLILRGWKVEDLDDFYEYAKHPDVGPSAGWAPHASKEISLKILQSFIDEGEVWAIIYRGNNKVIGSLGLHADRKRCGVHAKAMGYVLSADYWGRGIVTEAAKRVVAYAFDELNLDVLSIYHKPSNIRSKRVIEKCGFQYEGTLRQAHKRYDGQITDDVCYSILKSEYYTKGAPENL